MNNRFSVLLTMLLCLHSAVSGQPSSWEECIKAGDSAIDQARPADAEPAYREALKLSEKFKEKDPRRAVSLVKLAECLNSQSKGEEAEILAHRSLSALDKAISGSKPKDQAEEYNRTETTITILNKTADIFLANWKYSKAESIYKRVIAIREEDARTPEAPRSNEDYLKFLAQVLTDARAKLADAYDRLAKLYFVQKRFEEAELLYGKSIKILEAQYGPEMPPAAIGLSNLAVVYAAQDKYDMAEKLFARAVKIYEQSNWLDKPEVATTFENYSLLLKKTGRQAEASVMLERARQIRAKPH
jgi:tetratricopeptide (TPR) repeat protein